MARWRMSEEGGEPEGYILSSGIIPDLEAAQGCKECHGEGYLVCNTDHFVVRKQVNVITGEERLMGMTQETCFGHLCHYCQPEKKLLEEKLSQ